MKKIAIILGLMISAVFISSCSIRTPEIHGVVLDAETKEPVENAWVIAQWEIISLSLQGDVHSVPWQYTAWTDKEGKFKIPSKTKFALFSKLSRLSIHVHASYGRYAWIVLEKFRKEKLQIIVNYPKAVETRMGLMNEADVFIEHTGGVSSLCFGGRYGVGPKKKLDASEQQKCEDFLLSEDFLFLEKYAEDKAAMKKYGSIIHRGIAANYRRKGEYKKALEYLKKSKIYSDNYQIKYIEDEIKEVRELSEGKLQRGGENAK